MCTKVDHLRTDFDSFTGFGGQPGPSLWVIITAVVCIIALVLPMEGDKRFDLPHYLLLSVNQKLLASYILGKISSFSETFLSQHFSLECSGPVVETMDGAPDKSLSTG